VLLLQRAPGLRRRSSLAFVIALKSAAGRISQRDPNHTSRRCCSSKVLLRQIFRLISVEGTLGFLTLGYCRRLHRPSGICDRRQQLEAIKQLEKNLSVERCVAQLVCVEGRITDGEARM